MCSDTLHISGAARRLTQSRGNYTTWAARRAEQQQAYEKEAGLRAAEIDKMKEFAGHGFKYGGSSNAINKLKQLEKAAGKLEVKAAEQVRCPSLSPVAPHSPTASFLFLFLPPSPPLPLPLHLRFNTHLQANYRLS